MAGRRIVPLVAIGALAAAATAIAAPSNGGFETGNFNGWERTEPGNGMWQVYDAELQSNYPPPFGDHAARVVQGGPGLNILHRNLNAKDGRFLTFHLAYDNAALQFSAPRTFRFDNDDIPNQQLRVDLLRADAKIKSLKASDILETVFRTKEGAPVSSPYQGYVVDLEAEDINGKFQFRVAEVDNQQEFFVGLDQVSQSDKAP
jgi:hypothetical protein